MKKGWSIKMLTEGGIMIALATILSLVKIYEAPYGGSVTAGSMIPIIVFALRWGTVPGLIVGGLYGILQFIIEPYFYHYIQFLLDYPLAFGLLGLAGLAHNANKYKEIGMLQYALLTFSILLAISGRFVCHLLSGVVFFAEYAGDMNPWWYSTLYNGAYLLPEFIISAIIISILWKPLSRINK